MKRSRFSVTYPPERAHPVHRAIMAGTAISRMELLMWGPRSTITTLSWYDSAIDRVEGVLEAVDSTTDTELVASEDGTYAFVRQDAYALDQAILTIVRDAGVVFLPPITFHATGEVTFEAVGEPSLLSAFHDELSASLDTRIERVTDFRRPSSSAAYTDRQREAVSTAVAVGYYDIPRTGTVADIAAEMDCSTSTAGELLRKAESAIVRSAIDST